MQLVIESFNAKLAAGIAVIYDEQSAVKQATIASSAHVLKDATVQRAAKVVCAATDTEAKRNG
jgi:hypothetical protein